MNRHNRSATRCDRCLELSLVEVECIRMYIDKHWTSFQARDGTRSRTESEWGGNNLVFRFDANGHLGQQKRVGTGCASDRELYADILSYFTLQRIYFRAQAKQLELKNSSNYL